MRKLPLVWRRALVGLAAAVIVVLLVGIGTVQPRPVHLYVSNQSFAHPMVNLTVTMDGQPVVSQSFGVGDQHNWTLFEVTVGRGLMEVTESDTGAHLVHALAGGERWVVVDFWGANPYAGPITVTDSDHRVTFA